MIARIDEVGFAFPFTIGQLVKSPEFERFRLYFTDPEDWPEDDPALEETCRAVRGHGGFVLRNTDDDLVYEPTLNHDGADGVWFRSGDPVR